MLHEDKAKRVAERIADKLRTSEAPANYGSYEDSWDDLQSRLDGMYQDIRAGKSAPKLETKTQGVFIPQTMSVTAAAMDHSHASQDRFKINEAVVEELVEFFEKEKACSFEPNGKPCDHCAMCSSRGF